MVTALEPLIQSCGKRWLRGGWGVYAGDPDGVESEREGFLFDRPREGHSRHCWGEQS
ncbi:hypothetical protein NITLEN_10374 [Nitrospira lenta]|uniref:Uncharacterized protein n=1 Tax=Nitrospira lenta TaxID=1436998 RepID=A0A330L0J5_9BACT|nr:hypothetical protein NITLEN_10374 [Nitrospira lenta]